MKAQFSSLPSVEAGMLLPPQHPLCLRTQMDCKKTKVFKNLNIRNIETLRFRKCIYITVILYFHLVLNIEICQSNTLSSKLINLNRIIIKLDLDTIKGALSGLRQFLTTDKKCFLFHLKICFRSEDIYIFVLNFCSCRKMA